MTDDAVTVRPARPDDYDAICELWQAAGLSVRPRGRDARPEYLKQLHTFPTTYLVAECRGRIVGVVFGTHDVRKGWINRLAVHPEFRRRGIAKLLVARCEAALAEQGIGIVSALVEEGNEPSARFFRQCGYATDVPVYYFRKPSRADI